MIPAAPGWRIVFVDRESGEGAVALPIVAWEADKDNISLRPYYLPYEQGVLPLLLNDLKHEDLLGFLEPGAELDLAWHQAGTRQLEEERKREERLSQQ